MGVRKLWNILECCKETVPLDDLENKRICIDLSCWMVELESVNRSYCGNKEKMYLKSLFHRVRPLIALNCSLIFVTDGSIPAIKLPAYRRRLDQKQSQSQVPPKSLSRNSGSHFSRIIKEAKLLAAALGIPCLDGIEEAEAQCALLNSDSLCDGCFTSDSDAFLFGARTVYRDICLDKPGYVVCYHMDDIERKLGFGRNSLIALALLLGSDYSPGIRGIGPESACQMVKSAGDSAVLQQVELEGFSFIKKPKGSKKQEQTFTLNHENDLEGGETNEQVADQFMQVVKAYVNPKCHSAESDAVHRVLAVHPINLKQLQLICAQFFDWPPEKTDDYILPKIAERDLRRYNNLRHSSSDIGICVYLAEMPIKCPVSSIVKQRKLQGKDCFEVLWEATSALKTSILPADLIESACPEKILEFRERRAQAKKLKCHRPRQKKTKSNLALDEMDLNLDRLLVDYKDDVSSINNASLLNRSGLVRTDETDQLNRAFQSIDLNGELENKKEIKETWDHESTLTASRVHKTGVIDLVSPPPKTLAYLAAKPSKTDLVDVIDLSDSENEISPEHVRRAQELRLFLSKMKVDSS